MSVPERVSPKRGNNYSTGEDLLSNVTFEDIFAPEDIPVDTNAPKKREILEMVNYRNSNPSTFITNVISNKDLKIAYNEYLNTLTTHMLSESIELYKTINSDNFRILLDGLSHDEKTLLQGRIRNLLSSAEPLQRVSALIYNIINSAVFDNLDRHKTNSRYVYKTARNVQSSEDIESLGMTKMSSILSNFTNYRTFYKSSASKSVVFTAQLAPNPESVNVVKARNTLASSKHTLYFKMYPIGKLNDRFTFDNPGLDAERNMYSELFKLVKYSITPNILCRVATGIYPDAYAELMSTDRISSDVKSMLKRQITEVNTKYKLISTDYWKDVGLTITQPGGRTVHEAFINLSITQRRQVMFQLLYTLYVFEKLKISHGDLHSGNVFIIDVEPTELCFLVEGVQYRFTTTKLLKIYDFDQSNISAEKDITINNHHTIRINRVFNGKRTRGEGFDKLYGKGEQFVRKADLMIFIANGLRDIATNYNVLDFTGSKDPEFTYFIRTVMPGFYIQNPISRNLICDTYTDLLKNSSPQLIREFHEVFLIPEGEDINITTMKIGGDICNVTWNTYYSEVLPKFYGCLVKNIRQGELTESNTLMIPDTIVLPMIDMIKNPYFDELKSTQPIDITRGLVYTLDGKL